MNSKQMKYIAITLSLFIVFLTIHFYCKSTNNTKLINLLREEDWAGVLDKKPDMVKGLELSKDADLIKVGPLNFRVGRDKLKHVNLIDNEDRGCQSIWFSFKDCIFIVSEPVVLKTSKEFHFNDLTKEGDYLSDSNWNTYQSYSWGKKSLFMTTEDLKQSIRIGNEKEIREIYQSLRSKLYRFKNANSIYIFESTELNALLGIQEISAGGTNTLGWFTPNIFYSTGNGFSFGRIFSKCGRYSHLITCFFSSDLPVDECMETTFSYLSMLEFDEIADISLENWIDIVSSDITKIQDRLDDRDN